jgi:segment polarity protein dishevelled
MSTLKLHEDESLSVGPLPPPSSASPAPWASGGHMPYAGTFMPHPASGYAPMPFNYTNEPSVYGFAQEEQARSTSGNVSLVRLLF